MSSFLIHPLFIPAFLRSVQLVEWGRIHPEKLAHSSQGNMETHRTNGYPKTHSKVQFRVTNKPSIYILGLWVESQSTQKENLHMQRGEHANSQDLRFQPRTFWIQMNSANWAHMQPKYHNWGKTRYQLCLLGKLWLTRFSWFSFSRHTQVCLLSDL